MLHERLRTCIFCRYQRCANEVISNVRVESVAGFSVSKKADKEEKQIDIADVLAKSPTEYHAWLQSLHRNARTEEFFKRILQRGLIDAVLITVRQSSGSLMLFSTKDDDLFHFSNRVSNEDLRYVDRRETDPSDRINKAILIKGVQTLEILIDACRSDDSRRRKIGSQNLCRYLKKRRDKAMISNIVELFSNLLSDEDLFVRVFATATLWQLAPEKVCDRNDLVSGFLQHVCDGDGIDEDSESAREEVAWSMLSMVSWHNRDQPIDELLPDVHIRTSTDRDAFAGSIKRYYNALGKSLRKSFC